MAYLFLLLGVFTLFFIASTMGSEKQKTIREGLSAAQTVATLSILLIGLFWYFKERPDAARIHLELHTQATALEYPQVLIRSVLTLKNNGISRVDWDFDENCIKTDQTSDIEKAGYSVKCREGVVTFFVYRVKPFRSLSDDEAEKLPDAFRKNETNRSLFAALSGPKEPSPEELFPDPRFDWVSQDIMKLDFGLETGESETKDYFRILDCEENEIVGIEAILTKKSLWYELFGTDRVWVVNDMFNLATICEGNKGEE